jgi:pyruvate dehydrogenase phosphatase regulatory subunit
VDAGKVSEVLAFLAHQGGAKFVSGCGVRAVRTGLGSSHAASSIDSAHPDASTKNVHVTGVETELGDITCEYFVNCAGIWAREIGRLSKPSVRIPVCPAEHFFMTFKPLEELRDAKLPNVRDYDAHIYVRQLGDRYMMGAFEALARPWDVSKHGIDPDWNTIKEQHWRHFEPYIRAAMKRIPALKDAQYDFLMNTPDAFTPDGRWILGETPEVANYFVCAGMNGNSLQGAGGVGQAVADWIVKGYPPGEMLQFEVQRFTALHNNSRFLRERSKEVVGRHYKLDYPLVSEFKFGRNIRCSSVHSECEARGAVFGELMGWERPLYFDPLHHREDPPAQLPEKGTFGKPDFFDHIEDEYLVCREGVGLIDMSSFAKFIVRGDSDSVVTYLQTLCSNNVDIPVGGIVPTGMQNEGGGYENDCMLIRRDSNTFFMVSPTQQQTRIMEWMENHLPKDNTVGLQDVTSMYTVLSIAGPKSKDLMEELCREPMDMDSMTYREVNVGYASGVIIMASTNTGESGFTLYIPSEFALQIYDNLIKVGRDYGIRNVGHLAMRFLRIEKFVPFWAEELTSETTPMEVNKTFKVQFDKEHFIGKKALLKQRDEGVTKRLVQFHLEDFDKDTNIWPWGGEAVYRNGESVGVVSSTAYGFTLRKMVALGFVRHPTKPGAGGAAVVEEEWILDPAAVWTIAIAGKQHSVSVHLEPPPLPVILQQETAQAGTKSKKNYPTVQLLNQKRSSSGSKTR